jgi:hypothetical protein
MTKIITPTKIILDKIQNLTPQQQQEVINFIEFLQFKAQNPQNIIQNKTNSFLENAKEYIGSVEGGPGDLATNKEYLKNMGK